MDPAASDRSTDVPPFDDVVPHQNPEYVTSLAHFYRGELSRMIAWRDRLDRTTNWAIAASAAMLSVTLSSPDSHHAVILCCMGLVFLLLIIESRRFRFYDISHYRIRLMERFYYAQLLQRKAEQDTDEWRVRLGEQLRSPSFTVSTLDAMGNRLRRNYGWIYATLLISWWLKVSSVVLNARLGEARFVSTIDGLIENARVAYIPGALVWCGVLSLAVILLYAGLRPLRSESSVVSEEADV